jgi:hypothetical protein
MQLFACFHGFGALALGSRVATFRVVVRPWCDL